MEKFDAYLGLLTLIGRRIHETFAFLKGTGLEKAARLEGEVAF